MTGSGTAEPEWFTETLHDAVAQRLVMSRVVYRERTAHQDLVIFENPVYGRVLALDGVVQTTTADEHVYHEMIAHVPILAHGRVRRVLIIGGGDGGALRRCLMHPVETVTLVEIDDSVIDLCTTYLPSIAGSAFADPRTELVIADGCRFVKDRAGDRGRQESDGGGYDVIIVDSTDPRGPGQVLFTAEFFADCKSCLAPGGVFVNQSGVPFLQGDELRDTHRRLCPLYVDVWAYGLAVPSYYGGIMTLGWAADEPALRHTPVEELRRRYAAAGLATRHYTPELHAASFALPNSVIERMTA